MGDENPILTSYEIKSTTDFRGVTRQVFIGKIGSSTYQCFSLDELIHKIKNHKERDDDAAAEAFYNR
tara:strand:- start:157 stop:357 length:201 start_codon:yes stop_codon:yes gene_type:complete